MPQGLESRDAQARIACGTIEPVRAAANWTRSRQTFSLNISRYVSTAKDEVEIDLSVTHKELVEIERQVWEVMAKHNAFLKELGLSLLPRPD